MDSTIAKSRIKNSYAVICSTSFFGVCTLLSAGLLLSIYLLMQKKVISKWLKNYFNYLLKLHSHNPLLRLSLKDIEILLNKKALLSSFYVRSTFMGLGIGSLVAILSIAIILTLYYRSRKNSEKLGDKDIPLGKMHMVAFTCTFAISLIIIVSCGLVALHYLLPSNMPQFINDCIADLPGGSEKNLFTRICQGIIKASITTDDKHDIIIVVKRNLSIISYILIGSCAGIAMLCAVYIIYSLFQDRQPGNIDDKQVPDNELDDSLIKERKGRVVLVD